jgi:hypothetical protein
MVVVHQHHEESLLARHEQDRQEAAKMATWHGLFEGFFHEVQNVSRVFLIHFVLTYPVISDLTA